VNTTLAVLGSAVVVAVVLASAAAVLSVGEPTAPEALPLEARVVQRVTCTGYRTYTGDGYRITIPSSFRVDLEIYMKSLTDTPLIVDRIAPMAPGLPPLNRTFTLAPGETLLETVEAPWGTVRVMTAVAEPGDVLEANGLSLELVEPGRIAVVSEVPDDPPSDYACPFGTVYDLQTAGKLMSVDAEEPGCAPTRVATVPPEFFLVAAFTPLNYIYPEHDITFYVHVDAPEGFPGVAYLGGTGDGLGYARLQSLAEGELSGYPGPGTDPIPLALHYGDGWMTVYYAGGQYVESAPQVASTADLYVGLARQAQAKNKLQLVIAIDSSVSMREEWNEVQVALLNSFELLEEKNAEIALAEFGGPNPRAAAKRAQLSDYYIYYDSFIGLTGFYDSPAAIIQLLSKLRPMFWIHELDANAMYAALTMLPWDTSPTTARVLVLIVDECDQARDITPEDVIAAAQEKGVMIYVILADPNADSNCGRNTYKTGEKYATYVEATGGELFVLGVNATRLGETLLDIIENVNMTPITLETRVDYLGVFKSPLLRVEGLYPGDIVYIYHAGGVKTVAAESAVLAVNVVEEFGLEAVVETLATAGGFTVMVVPTVERVIAMLPSSVAVHAVGAEHDMWVVVDSPVILDCQHGVEVDSEEPMELVAETREGLVWLVEFNGALLGSYPGVAITVAEGTVTLYTPSGAQALEAPVRLTLTPPGYVGVAGRGGYWTVESVYKVVVVGTEYRVLLKAGK